MPTVKCGAAILLSLVSFALLAADPQNAALTKINPAFVVTAKEATDWHRYKDQHGPALSGNPSWQKYMTFVEDKLREYGAVDITRNRWTYDYWSTSNWPDNSQWSLTSNGKDVRVANYGANSGSTGPSGKSATMIYYDPANPPKDIAGKIVVFETKKAVVPIDDYEYYTSPSGTSPSGRAPAISAEAQHQNNIRMNNMGPQLRPFIEQVAIPGKAAGIIFVFDANFERLKGYYTFGVPAIHDAPTVFVDREVGKVVVADAKRGAPAKIKLVATVTPVETWQTIAYLPGKHYGTPQDEQVQITTHSDGPSISQDDGPFGLLAAVKYFAKIPREQRPRTLLFFVDNRHYMPGMERAFEERDWFHKHPEARTKVKAVLGLEHLGEREYFENGEKYTPTGQADDIRVWVTNNQRLVDLSIAAVKEHQLPNTYVRNVDRPGVAGKSQGGWRGLAGWGRRAGLPTFALMGDLDAYWSTASRLDRFDADLFVKQVAVFAQMTGHLMTADLSTLQAPPISAR
ncbi:MAG TPA: hypothetical protein VK629_11625 [Steroidobacteraceae bacterium]|nr:hypothetical protein [Steroidobacteraceae bacterium]